MTGEQRLPLDHESLLDPQGNPNRFYRAWFRRIQSMMDAGVLSGPEAATILSRLATLEAGGTAAQLLAVMYGTRGVQVFGDLANGVEIRGPDLTGLRNAIPGIDGEDGEDSWVPGPTGKDGAAGVRGNPGLDGNDGEDGIQGPPGARGVDGVAGANGAAGPQGNTVWMQFEDAPEPEVGPRGPQGETGPQGATGAPGSGGGASTTIVQYIDEAEEAWPVFPSLAPNLTAIGGQTTAADQLIYWTGASLASMTGLTADARLLLADADVPRLSTANTWSATQTVNAGLLVIGGNITLNRAGTAVTVSSIIAADATQLAQLVFRDDTINRWIQGRNTSGDYFMNAHDAAGVLVGTGVLSISNSLSRVNFNVAPTLTAGQALAVTDGGTGFESYTVGDITYADTTTTLAKLAAGTATYVLTSNGPGVAPSYQAPPGGGSGLTHGQVMSRVTFFA